MTCLLLAGLAARTGFLSSDFWLDETFTAMLIVQPTPKLLRLCRSDVHPPAHFMILRGWNRIGWRLSGRPDVDEPWEALRFDVGQLATAGFFTLRSRETGETIRNSGVNEDHWGEWRLMPLAYLRALSIPIALGYVALVWWIAALLYPDRPSMRVIATALTALSPFLLSWGAIIRSYPWYSACFLAAAVAGLWGAQHNRWRVAGPTLVFAVAAALLFHYSTLIFLPLLALAVWRHGAVADPRRQWRGALVGAGCIGLGVALAFAVWGEAFLEQRRLAPVQALDVSGIGVRFVAAARDCAESAWQFPYSYGCVPKVLTPFDSPLYYPAFAIYAAGLGAAVFKMIRRPAPSDWIVAILGIGPFALYLAGNTVLPGAVPLFARHYYPVIPFFFMFLCIGWIDLFENVRLPKRRRAQ